MSVDFSYVRPDPRNIEAWIKLIFRPRQASTDQFNFFAVFFLARFGFLVKWPAVQVSQEQLNVV
jgi:hypothetical protein